MTKQILTLIISSMENIDRSKYKQNCPWGPHYFVGLYKYFDQKCFENR